MKIVINGAGCCLIDYIYANVDFCSQAFDMYTAQNEGDGGISPGKLVFSEDLERFADKPFKAILRDIVGDKNPDKINLGGPAVVALLNAAQLLGSNYHVSFQGIVSEDQAGKAVFDFLKNTPLMYNNIKIASPGKTTAYTVVLSDPIYSEGKGERTFINTIGVSGSYTPQDLSDDFFNADIVYFGGTALVPPLHDNLTNLLKRAKKQGAFTIVGTVYDFRNEKQKPREPWPLGEENSYPFIDLLITGLEEAKHLVGLPYDVTAPNIAKSATKAFREYGLGACIITRGAESIYLYAENMNGKDLWIPCSETSMPVSVWVDDDLAAYPEKRGDTTGCGDNFAGGVLAALAEQKAEIKGNKRLCYDLLSACVLGVASGGFTLFYHGGAYFENYPGEKRKKVMQIARKYEEQIGIARGR